MPDNSLSGKVGLDVTDFKSGISELNRNIRVVESGFQAAASGLGDWSKSADGLALRIKALSGEIDLQKSKIAALAAEHARVAAEQGEGSKAAQDLEVRLNKETATLGKMQYELGTTENSLTEMGGASGEAAKETEKLGKEEQETTGHTSKFAGALEGLKAKLNAGVTGLKNMVVNVAKVGAGLALGLVAGAAGAVTGLGALLFKTAKTSDELVETAEKIGITTTRLQELNYIADQTGTGVDTMQSSMAKMTRSLATATTAGTPAADAFKQLGVSVTDSNGQLRDSADIYFDAIAALKGVGNETERDILAQQLFGKSADELNPLINLGADGMKAMADQAHALGAVMGEETVTGMADLNDKIGGVKAGFMGLVGTLVAGFLPVAQQVVAWIQDSAIPWLQVNLPKAIQFLSDVWNNVLLPAIKAVWGWMSTVLIPFLANTVFPWLQENIPKALQTLSNFWTTILLPAIRAVWNWMSTVLIPFIQNTVVPWLQVKIPAALKALADFWNAHKEAVSKTVQALWDTLMKIWEVFRSAFSTVMELFHLAMEGNWRGFGEKLRQIWDNMWEGIKTAVSNAVKAIKDFFLNTDWAQVGKDIIKGLGSGMGAMIEWLKGVAVKIAKAALDAIKGFFGIESPSKVMASQVGAPMALGVGEGFARQMGIVQARIQASLSGMAGLPAGGTSYDQRSYSYYTIQAANSLQTSDDLARQVRLLELMH